MRCMECGVELPKSRSDRRTCSPRCRMALSRRLKENQVATTITTEAGRDLISWRGQHAKWTEQRWIDAIVAIEREAVTAAFEAAGGFKEDRLDAAALSPRCD